MRIHKLFNNNVLLAVTDDGQEHIVMGRGIGFGAKAGDEVDPGKVTQTFVPVDAGESFNHIHALLAEIPLDILSLAADVAKEAHREFGIAATAGFVLPLADHLAFALASGRDRCRLGAGEHPLATEVRQFYPRELAFSRKAVQRAAAISGTDLPPGDDIAVALHLVNAQFTGNNFATTVRMTKTVGQVLDVVDALTGQPVDRESTPVARFLTHLRYLFAQLDIVEEHGPRQSNVTLASVEKAMRAEHPDAHRAAQRMAYLIESGTGKELSRNEITYLTLHVVRLTSTA